MKMERTKRVGDKVYTYTRSPEAVAKENAAKRAYIARTYERLTLDVPKGMLQALTALATERGISRRKLILDLLEKELNK
mgnify:FL=1